MTVYYGYTLEFVPRETRPWVIRRWPDGHVVFRITGQDKRYAEQIHRNLGTSTSRLAA